MKKKNVKFATVAVCKKGRRNLFSH